jgi:hypothetical protein
MNRNPLEWRINIVAEFKSNITDKGNNDNNICDNNSGNNSNDIRKNKKENSKRNRTIKT